MAGFFDKFGKSVKGVIGGMILGIFLLPVGVFMQKCAVDQMQYHKHFEKAAKVQSAEDNAIGSDATVIKTEGVYRLSDGSPYQNIRTQEGHTFDGKYIDYYITKYIAKKEIRETEDSDGNKKTEIVYDWEEVSGAGTSYKNPTVSVNGFNTKFLDFKQTYIPTATKVFKYMPKVSNSGVMIPILQEKYTSMPGDPSENDVIQGVYLKTLDGYVYDDNDETITVCGIANKGTANLTAIKGKGPQKMLVIAYGGFEATMQRLKQAASTERLMKFIIGTLCFMFGFTGIFGPIIKILDIIPIAGDIAIGIIYFLCAIVSLLLSVIFYIFFKFFWILVILAIAIPLVLFILKKKKQTA